jgi:integrase/recombinase XerD
VLGAGDGLIFRDAVFRGYPDGIAERATKCLMEKATAEGIAAEAVGVCVHSMRATAATNALSNEADIAKVQEWLGHANVSTTRLYDRRKTRPEDCPTFHVKY